MKRKKLSRCLTQNFFACLQASSLFARLLPPTYYNAPFNVGQPDIGISIEVVLIEVDVLEVGVHVDAGGSEVVGARDVGDHALPALPNLVQAHPHVPVPHLKRDKQSAD